MNRSSLRATLLFSLLTLGFLAVLGRSIQLQWKPDSRLVRMANNKDRLHKNAQKDEILTSRGAVLDRNRKDLALSVMTKSFFANPKVIKNPQSVAQKLSPLLDSPASKILELLKQDRYFVWLKREVDEETANRIEELDIEGIYSRKESKRIYPHGELGRSLLGVSGRDGSGLEGIEKQYDEYLKTADKGGSGSIRDALGRLLLFNDFEREWFESYQILTTIDVRLQKIMEEELRATVNGTSATSGQAIMMNPKTGEILALASIEGKRPDYNPVRNRVISDVYEPGSTFKIFLAAAAMEHLKMTASSPVFGENGFLRVGNHVIKEFHGHKYEWLSLQQLLEVSSNIAAAKLGLKMGAPALEQSLKKFGFGQLTGVDLPGEASGLMRSGSSWKPIELANISFGQGIAVSPLQLVRAVSAIANGGYLVTPHVVSEVLSPQMRNSEGRVVWKAKSEREEILPADRAKALTDMLSHITDEGSTGREAAIEGYSIAGKTGTSQKLVEKVNAKGKTVKAYSSDRSIVSFLGYVPAYDPAFVLLVLYDDPQGRDSDGKTAAPSFRKIASRSLAVMGIPPEKDLVAFDVSSAPLETASETSSRFVGKRFQDVLKEIRNLPPEERAKIDLIGYGIAIKEEVDQEERMKVYFK